MLSPPPFSPTWDENTSIAGVLDGANVFANNDVATIGCVAARLLAVVRPLDAGDVAALSGVVARPLAVAGVLDGADFPLCVFFEAAQL